MKITIPKIKICIVVCLIISVPIFAQNIESELDQLKSAIENVAVKDVEYKQSINYKHEDGYIISFSSTDSKKDKTTSYRFNLNDLRQDRINFEIKKNVAVVELETKGNKKLIHTTEEDEIQNYLDKIEIKANNVESARKINDYLKSAVKLAETDAAPIFEKQDDLVVLLGFLESNIGKVSVNDDVYEQSFSFDNNNRVIVTFNTNHINKSTSESLLLNFGDIKLNSIDFNTKGSEVFVEAATTDGADLIEYSKNGKITGFKKELTLKANTVEEARKLTEALKNLRELADNYQLVDYDESADYTTTMDYLLASIRKTDRGNGVFEQTFKPLNEKRNQVAFEIKDIDKNRLYEYVFNPADIQASKVAFSTKGSEILINCETGKKSLIKTSLNGALENYEDQFEIRARSIESARNLVKAIKRMILLTVEQTKKFNIEGNENPTLKATLDYLIKQISDVTVNDETFRQSLFYEDEKPEIVTLEVIESGKDEKKTFEFNVKDLDKASINYDTKGKEVLIEATINKKEDLIKSVKNNEDIKYVDALSIRSQGIEDAKMIVEALKFLIGVASS